MEPRKRSRSKRRIFYRTPGGKTKIRFEKRKKGDMFCAICGEKLQGVSQSGSKTEKRPTRKFGGVLCHKCTQEVIRMASLVKEGEKVIEDIPPKYVQYVRAVL